MKRRAASLLNKTRLHVRAVASRSSGRHQLRIGELPFEDISTSVHRQDPHVVLAGRRQGQHLGRVQGERRRDGPSGRISGLLVGLDGSDSVFRSSVQIQFGGELVMMENHPVEDRPQLHEVQPARTSDNKPEHEK